MHLHEITAESLTKTLNVEVPDIFVIVAKHSVMGMDSVAIKQIIGCELADIEEVEATDLYKGIRALIAKSYNEQTLNQSSGWDAIEGMAIKNLIQRIPHERDTETLLRVAAVANKATRRHDNDSRILDPGKSNGQTVITLTQRLVSRINKGHETTEETRQLSISDGTMSNPSFSELDSLLAVNNQPVLPKRVAISTRNADPSMDELMEAMARRK